MGGRDPEVSPEEEAVVVDEAATAAEPADAPAQPADAPAQAADAVEAAEVVEVDLAELQGELSRTQVERDDFLALAQRTQADFENFRKRVSRDVSAAEARGISKVTRELLPALDNLDRAIAAAHPATGGADEDAAAGAQSHLTEGIRLVHAELVAALARVGIEGFAPQGEPFDPTEHEAIATQPVDGAEPGTVVEVLQPGYRLASSVLRPARVVVAA